MVNGERDDVVRSKADMVWSTGQGNGLSAGEERGQRVELGADVALT